MEELKINYKEFLEVIVDAFTQVYGKEYHDIIFQRINNAIIISYWNIEELASYLKYIKICKSREYALEFLEKIGVNVEKYKRKNYVKPLDTEVEKIIETFIYSPYYGFNFANYKELPIQIFKQDNDNLTRLNEKLAIINYLLNENNRPITAENFHNFILTEDYQKVLEKIEHIDIIYEKLLEEYTEWKQKLKPYEQLIETERRKKAKFFKDKQITLLINTYHELPVAVKATIGSKNLEEKSIIVYNNEYLNKPCDLEYFSVSTMEMLNSKNIKLEDKLTAIFCQKAYLERLGINLQGKEFLHFKTEEDLSAYLNFLKQEDVKKYLPSQELIKHITMYRQALYEEANKQYCMASQGFKEAMAAFDDKNNEELKYYLYIEMKNKEICVSGFDAYNENNEQVAIMFYTLRFNMFGYLFYAFLHECGHIIDKNKNATGLDILDDNRNQYNDSLRKYEQINEALNDIFTNEAIELIHNCKLYFIEPEEYTIMNTNECNTNLIIKNLLTPLVTKFRAQVIKAKITSSHLELTKYIGTANFEELVDIVNKVNYLIKNGLVSKLAGSSDDEIVREYNRQLEKIKIVYNNIDNYYNANFKDNAFFRELESGKSRSLLKK